MDELKTKLCELFEGIMEIALISLIIMLLWNVLLPGLFGLTTITYWQAIGLRILTRGLMGSREVIKKKKDI